jgi:HrpA-like RNA helicase
MQSQSSGLVIPIQLCQSVCHSLFCMHVLTPPPILLPSLSHTSFLTARDKLVEAVTKHRSLIIVGETGSGKTTQLPQYLREAGWNKGKKMIAVTQPRRVAAITVAQRVADEVGCKLGNDVGYCIRFDDCSTRRTNIKYMTDGMLLREAHVDPLLSRYSVILLDEAHERTLHTDILFALVKSIQKKRVDLHVVCMSATLQADAFSKYFNNAPVLYVSGRQFPVSIYYADEPQPDYLDAVVISVLQIHLTKPLPGDILVFLTGQEEIETARAILEDKIAKLPKNVPSFYVTPIYAALPSHEQLRVFEPTPKGVRKVILATNIAETSITINGIRYVVDTGVAKVRQYHARTGMDCLIIVPVSKAEAWQRTGRAGRQQAGECYRLYTEDAFEDLREAIVPEILRTNLANVVLQLKSLGVNDILGFDFMDKPPRDALVSALEQLYALGCLDDSGNVSEPLGRQCSMFPLDPMFSKAILCSAKFGCTEEILTIVAMLSADAVFVTPKAQRDKAMAAKKRFGSYEGDHITYLNVFRGYQEAKKSNEWCKANFINAKSMKKVCKGMPCCLHCV